MHSLFYETNNSTMDFTITFSLYLTLTHIRRYKFPRIVIQIFVHRRVFGMLCVWVGAKTCSALIKTDVMFISLV